MTQRNFYLHFSGVNLGDDQYSDKAEVKVLSGSCHKRQKPQVPTPQAPIRNRQTRKVANAKGLNHSTNLA